jgi:esterase/lipase superfamily enzyme
MTNLPEPILKASEFWAIPVTDTDNRTWAKDINSSSLNYQFVRYDIDLLEEKPNQTKISIAIAKKHPEYSNKKIMDIAYGIYNYPKIKEGDGILAVRGNNIIEKVGIVSNVSFESRNFIFYEFRWIELIKETQLEKPIFDDKVELQRVTPKMLQNIIIPVAFTEDMYYEVMSEKAYYKSPFINLEFMRDTELEYPKEEKGGSIKLFYGTNRNKTGDKNLDKFYGNELSDLKFGECTVSMPKGHIQGEIERPKKFLVFQFPEKRTRHIVVDKIEEVDERTFLQNLAADFVQLDRKSAFIFIHGYNNSFSEAAWRTAQIAWDVPFNGLAGFFSWPSNAATLAYLKDIELADATIPQFEEFIEKFVIKTKVEKLHLIAHSMGNRLLTTTLNNLSSKSSFVDKLSVFQQIVLAAPDIDQDVFKNSIFPKLKNIGSGRTLYSSDRDKALHFSENLRGGRPRLGDAGNDLYVSQNLDTLDASNVNSGGNHHSYIFDTKELLADLHLLLNHNFSPIDRRLRARIKNNLPYWLFPR